MEKSKISGKISIEIIYIAIVFSFLLFLGLGNLWNHQIKHEFPYAYFASDAFQHQTRAEGIKEAGSYKNEPFYNVFGVKDVVGYYPPVLYHLAVILSHLSGLEVYDTIYFLPFFFAALSAIIIYFVIRKLSIGSAILAMPLAVLLFYKGAYTGFTWGVWPSLISQFFLVAFFWSIANIDIEKSSFLFAILLSAVIMSHTSEAFFAGFMLTAYFTFRMIKKTATKDLIKKILIGALLTLIISSFYLVIFRGIWMERQPYSYSVIKEWGSPTLFIADFKILILFFAVGLIACFLLIKNENIFPIIMSILMLLFSYTNYVGFGDRAFQLRYFWGVYLSVLFGFGIYHLAKTAYRKWSSAHSIILAVVIFIVISFAGIEYFPSYEKISSPGIMNRNNWDTLQWISKNTEQDAVIYFFYGDAYNQDAILRNSKRTHKLIVPQDYADAINKKEIRRYFETESPGDGGGGAAIRKGLLSFEFKLDEMEKNKEFEGKKDICSFDYYVFDKGTAQTAFAQYNIIMAKELLKKDFVKLVYGNDNTLSIILKNTKPGEDCIEEGTIA